jgi:hypothetical protein
MLLHLIPARCYDDRTMHAIRLLFLGFLCFLSVLPAQDPTASKNTDSAIIVAVLPGPEVELQAQQTVRFEIAIHYVLRSVDRAILAVYAERYTVSPSPCDPEGTHHTEGGTRIAITRGEGDVKLSLMWKESTDRYLKIPLGEASLAFGANLWTENNGRPVKPIIHAFGTSFCRPIKP